MDINQFRKHLARVQNIQEAPSPKVRDLYDQIHDLHRAGSLKKMVSIANNVWAHLEEMQKQDKFNFNRKHPHLLKRLETLIDMLESGRVDPSEAEILQTEIMADLLRM